MTLLEKALAVPTRKTYVEPTGDELLELVVAWASGQINTAQFGIAAGKPHDTAARYLASNLIRDGVMSGRLSIEIVKDGKR